MCSSLTKTNLVALQSQLEDAVGRECHKLLEQKRLRGVQKAAVDLGFKLPGAKLEKYHTGIEECVEEQSQ